MAMFILSNKVNYQQMNIFHGDVELPEGIRYKIMVCVKMQWHSGFFKAPRGLSECCIFWKIPSSTMLRNIWAPGTLLCETDWFCWVVNERSGPVAWRIAAIWRKDNLSWLVVWNMTFIFPNRDDDPIWFFHILGIVTPTDELHDFSEG